MLKFSISKEAEVFRQEFRTWLEGHKPEKVLQDSSLENFVRVGRQWQSTLAKARWVGVHWPKEYGGRGLSLVEEAIIQEELVRAASPQLLGLFGLSMVGPILIQYGTDIQKKRYLSKILSGEEVWCQGFSETEAGSDLASIRTRAEFIEEKRQKGFLISGAKIWTSFAHVADWCFLLVRTSDHKSRYEGMSYLLVDMKTPGISVRPLKQITGDEEFNEVFFDKVFVPEENLIGNEGEGWKLAIATLMHERVILTFARQLQSEVLLRDLLTQAKSFTKEQRDTLTREIASLCAVRALAYEHLSEYASGKHPGVEGSLDKLAWTSTFQSLAKFAMNVRAEGMLPSEEVSADVHRYLYSRGRSIAAGTSEIQRNIIAERILGLPKAR